MKPIVKAFLILSSAGVLILLALVGLALAGSPDAPPPLTFYDFVFAVIGAAGVMAFLSVRGAGKLRTAPMVWRAGAEIPAEMGPERRRRLVVRGVRELAMPLLAMAFLFATMLLMIGYPKARLWGRLRRDGVDTTGTVEKVRRYSTKSASVAYAFRTPEGEAKGRASVPIARADSFVPGRPITVCYVPGLAPGLSPPSLPTPRKELTVHNALRDAGADGLVPFALLPGFVLLPVWMRERFARARRLLDAGAPGIGTVSTVRGRTVRYTFDAPGGTAEGKFEFSWAARPSPAPGDRFPLLFDPERPARSSPWAVVKTFTLLDDGSPAAAGPIPGSVALERELMQAPPAPGRHAVRMTWQLPVTLAVLLLMPLPQLLRLADGSHARRLVARLTTEGVETVGRLRSLRRIPERGHDPLAVSYEFTTTGGRTYAGSFVVRTRKLEDRFGAAGDPVPVVYAPSDPGVSAPLRKTDLTVRQIDPTASAFVPFATAIAVIYGGFLLFILLRALREWRMARDGRLVLAKVLEIRSGIPRKLRYQFLSDHGVVDQTVSVQSNRFVTTPGETIEVLFTSPPLRSMPVRDLTFFRRAS